MHILQFIIMLVIVGKNTDLEQKVTNFVSGESSVIRFEEHIKKNNNFDFCWSD